MGRVVGSGVGVGAAVGVGTGVGVATGVDVGIGEGEGVGGDGVGVEIEAIVCAGVGSGAVSGSESPQAVSPTVRRHRRPTASMRAERATTTLVSLDISALVVEVKLASQRKLGRQRRNDIATPITCAC